MKYAVLICVVLAVPGCLLKDSKGGVAKVSHTVIDIRDAKVTYTDGDIAKSEGGSVFMNRREAKGTQPDTPAGPATASLDEKGGGKASVPQTEAAPAPPTPVDEAFGVAIYIGIGLIVFGAVSLFAKKWFPTVPFGLSVSMIVTGVGVMFLASLFDSTPWWAWFAVGGAGLGVAWAAGAFDNWRQKRK